MNISSGLGHIFRSLLRDKRFTALSITVITLGITIVMCVYVLTYEIYERPLPFSDGDRIVIVKSFNPKTNQTGTRQTFNSFVFNQLRQNADSFEELGAVRGRQALLTDGETTSLVLGASTTPNLINMTGVQPLLGRTLHDTDGQENANPVALISESLWQSYYAGDRNIVGTQTRINGQLHTIVGVMPKHFRFPEVNQDIWFPLQVPTTATVEDSTYYTVIGKLTAQSSARKATQDVNRLLTSVATQYTPAYENLLSKVQSYRRIGSTRTSELQPAIVILGIVLFALACVNLNALLFVRNLNRVKELNVRRCVGATHWQLFVRMILEALILCTIGLLVSLVLSQSILTLVSYLRNSAPDATATISLGLSFRSLPPILGMVVVIWFVPSAVAAFRMAVEIHKSSTRNNALQTGRAEKSYALRLIIGGQILLSCFLLMACGMLTTSIYRAYQTDFGVANKNIVVADFNLYTSTYQNPQAKIRFMSDLKQQVLQHAEITDLAFVTTPASRNPAQVSFSLADRTLLDGNEYPMMGAVWISHNYFQTLDVDLVDGREFDSSDNRQSNKVVIVDENFADNMWPGQSAIGQEIVLNPSTNAVRYTVIGVNSHIVQGSPVRGQELTPTFYFPLTQEPKSSLSIILKTRSKTDINRIAKTIKLAFTQLDRQIPVYEFYTMTDFQLIVIDDWGVIGLLFLLVAVCAVALAVTGIYGLISRSVIIRTLEVGLRRALGSEPKKIIFLFLAQGSQYLMLGLIFGIGLTLVTSDYLVKIFPTILDSMPLVAIAICFLMGTLILLATYVPAKKAVKLEPGQALRFD